jgi:hypothetical protein
MRTDEKELFARSDRSLSERALKEIVRAYGVELPHIDFKDGIDAINESGMFPVRLDVRRLSGFTLEQMLKSFQKTKLFAAYFKLWKEVGWDEGSGMITPAFGTKLYIMHNDTGLEAMPGSVRIVHQTGRAGSVITFESLRSFASSACAAGWRLE